MVNGRLKRYGNRQFILMIALALFLYAVLPQLSSFRHSLSLAAGAHWRLVLAAIGFVSLTYLAAAATYCLLVFRPLNYAATVLVQLASNFVNRLLPAGIGALGANYAYLRHKQHSRTEAATVVAVNNSLGVVGHIIVAFIAALVAGRQALDNLANGLPKNAIWLVAIFIIFIIVGLSYAWSDVRAARLGKGLLKQLDNLRHKPANLALALISSMSLTVCNVASLWLCAAALGIHLAFLGVFIIFTLGTSLGTITPSPGGLGGVEAGLVAGLVAYHVPLAQALTTALLYRLISYWLPLLVGGVAFIICQKQQMFSSKA